MKNTLFSIIFSFQTFFIFAQKPQLFILSVGVSTYENSSLNLNYADDDARDIANALRLQTTLWDIREANVLTDEMATRSNIREELDRFKGLVTEDDFFVFVFSGHGLKGRLIPFDFKSTDIEASSLSQEELNKKLNALGCGYIVFLDACYSGSFAKDINGKDITVEESQEQLRDLINALENKDKPYLIFGSSASNQRSLECDECYNGYFAQSLLDALENLKVSEGKYTYLPDQNNDGNLSSAEFDNYIKESVRVRTKDKEETQKVYSQIRQGRTFPLFTIKSGEIPPPPPEQTDRDGDGVFDLDDNCPTEYGTRNAKGCPDADDDDVPDKSDLCKYEYGEKKYQGCPDSDKDGVPDNVDKCPNLKGLPKMQGCPDEAAEARIRLVSEKYPDITLVRTALSDFPFDEKINTSEQEARRILKWLGVQEPINSVQADNHYMVWGNLPTGFEVRLWTKTYEGDGQNCYGIRFQTETLKIFIPVNDTYLPFCKGGQ